MPGRVRALDFAPCRAPLGIELLSRSRNAHRIRPLLGRPAAAPPRNPPRARRPWGHEPCSRSLKRNLVFQPRPPTKAKSHLPTSGACARLHRLIGSSTARLKSIRSTLPAPSLVGASSGTRQVGTGRFRKARRRAACRHGGGRVARRGAGSPRTRAAPSACRRGALGADHTD